MKPEVARILQGADTARWKEVGVEYGNRVLSIRVPENSPVLEALHRAGVNRENVTRLVGTGTHRPSTAEEKVAMFGEPVAAQYRIIDHDCDDESMLVHVGKTRRGPEIHHNRFFCGADVKVAPGLVEGHFMAGGSAGRKAISPALVSRKT